MHDESLPSRKKQREFVKACVEAGVVDHKVRSLAFFLILQHHYRNTSLKELTKAVLKLGLAKYFGWKFFLTLATRKGRKLLTSPDKFDEVFEEISSSLSNSLAELNHFDRRLLEYLIDNDLMGRTKVLNGTFNMSNKLINKCKQLESKL